MKKLIMVLLISLVNMQMQTVKPMTKEEIEKKVMELDDLELMELVRILLKNPEKYDELADKIKILVDKGAHVVSNEMYPLREPIECSIFRPEAVKYLLEHGKDVHSENAQAVLNKALGSANINFLRNPKLDSPLLESIKILLKHGAMVDKTIQSWLMSYLRNHSSPQLISGLVILLPLLDPKTFYLAQESNTSYLQVLPGDLTTHLSATIGGPLNLAQQDGGKTFIDLLKDLVQQYPNLPDTPKLQKMIEILEKKRNKENIL